MHIKFTEKQLDSMQAYTEAYIAAENAATGSLYDANANVTHKNVITLLGEMAKPLYLQFNRHIRKKKIAEMFGKELSEQYIKDIDEHNIYVHDETHALIPYCMSISLFPFLQNGSKGIGGNTEPPKHLSSFCGGLINLLNQIAAQCAGAVAIPSLLVCFDYFARKDFGDNYLKTNFREVEQEFQHFVYYLNEPCSGRNGQCIFWNMSMFDRVYLENMYGNFVYPMDMSSVNIPSVMNLQKYFMKWFNKERERSLLTFPVMTTAMVYDENHNFKDEDFLDFVSEEISEGNAFFNYISDNVDSLSSCCFHGNQKTLSKSSNGINFMSFKELYESKYNDTKKNFTIFHNGSWKKGKVIKVDGSKKEMFKIITSNNKEMIVTEDHEFPTIDGDKKVSDLCIDDYLMQNMLSLDSFPERDLGLKSYHGIIIGAYLGDGSSYVRDNLTEKAQTKYSVTLSINDEKYKKLKPSLEKICHDYEGRNCFSINKQENNLSVTIYSKRIYCFIKDWIDGDYCHNKSINNDYLLQSKSFREGIYKGYYITDGGNSNRIYTTSEKLVEQMECLFTSLGIATIIDSSDRTDEKVVIRGEEFNRNFILHCVRWYDSKNKRSMKNVYKLKNNSMFFKIKSIEKVQSQDDVYCFEMYDSEEPYFTLPNGIITHNCRLRNESKNEFSYTLGNVGEMTGSVHVITINMNRLIQNSFRKSVAVKRTFGSVFEEELESLVTRIHKYHAATRTIYQWMFDNHMYPIYENNFVKLERQFSTIGILGLVEGAEFLGYDIRPNKDYIEFSQRTLAIISNLNKKAKVEFNCLFNTEFVPGENAGVKLAKWDKQDGYIVKRNCYNSYFYVVEDPNITMMDKAKLYGEEVTSQLDGGSAIHYNMQQYLTKEQAKKFIINNAILGVSYFCFNILITCCEEESCGFINKNTLTYCSKCGSKNISHATRIIGFLKKIINFSEERQKEAAIRHKHKND